MTDLTIDHIKALCSEKRIKWTLHIIRKLQERGIYREDVFKAIETGKIIEQYPDDYPFPSCLLLGNDRNGKPLHLVIASDGSILFLITAYFPNLDKFDSNYETRKENL